MEIRATRERLDCLEHLDSKETQELPEISVEMEHQGLWERKVSQDLREFGAGMGSLDPRGPQDRKETEAQRDSPDCQGE